MSQIEKSNTVQWPLKGLQKRYRNGCTDCDIFADRVLLFFIGKELGENGNKKDRSKGSKRKCSTKRKERARLLEFFLSVCRRLASNSNE